MEVRLQWRLFLLALVACSKTIGQYLNADNCKPPNIIEESMVPIYYTIPSSHSINVPCKAFGSGPLTYTWMKDGHIIELTESKDDTVRHSLYPGVGTLVIVNATSEDTGSYQCKVVNKCGTSLSDLIPVSHAYIDPFPQITKPTVLKKALGSSVKLTCSPPFSVPKAKVRWVLQPKKDYRNDQSLEQIPVPLDKRVTMDYDGNLYITSLTKEDEQGGKKYVCSAENYETRSKNEGADKIIETIGNAISESGVEMLWHSNNQLLVLEGNRATFKCIFSGYPEPEIQWVKVVGNYDTARVEIKHHELIINDVRFEDAGEYMCKGSNGLLKEPKEEIFNLKVEALPKWKNKPQDHEVGVGESAVINCEASGVPEPEVKWYIDGRPIEDARVVPHRKLSGHTLTFTQLKKEDSQVIQCNASNIHGFVWSDVYLFVEAQPPYIEKPPLDEVIAVEGHDVRVTCHVKGKPKPTVDWFKDKQQLILDRYQIQEYGDLIIRNTTKHDTGSYRCYAKNEFGEKEGSGLVTVKMRTQIVTKPIGAMIFAMTNSTFTCGATTDPTEVDNLRIRWLKDGHPLTPSERIHTSGVELHISHATSADTGDYTCVAENGLDNDTAVATLQVQAVPDPPYNVSVKTCVVDRAVVVWRFEERMSNFMSITKFVLEYKTNHKDSWLTGLSAPPSESEITMNLSPFTKYRFRVRAVNKLGTSGPSNEAPSVCNTPEDRPAKNPSNVYTDEQFTGFLVIKWEPLDKIDENGEDFHYIVEITEKNNPGNKKTYENVTDTHLRIPVENIYSPYDIKVRASNKIGKALLEPDTFTGFSGAASPLVVAENFEVDPDVNVTATTAGFRWDPVDTNPELIRGEFIGYTIYLTWRNGTKHYKQLVKPMMNRGRRSTDGKVRGTVASLPSFSTIEAYVVVSNKNFDSNASNVVNFTTPEGVPGPVKYLVAFLRGSHHFALEWEAPEEENGVITGYQISYMKISRLDFGERVVVYDNLSPNDTRATLNNLQPATQYRIFISAKTVLGVGKEYYIDVRTTSVQLPIALPKITFANAGENEANITWAVNKSSAGDRHGQFYYIEIKKKNSKDWERQGEPVEDQLWGMLKHLEPGTDYQVRVVAVATKNGDEGSQPSEPFGFITAGYGAARASFLTAAWFIGMMVAIAILILILIIVCIIKRNRGDNYPVQEKERLRGNYNDENQDHFNEFGKGDENGIGGSSSFDRDAEKVPLDEDTDSLDYGDDDGSKFNEDGSFIGQYGRGEKGNEGTNASSIV
ncbi:neuroglian-like isoform X2 [Physella acuta]|uniref:neuroglian-like isoform X2 n=1 Tax=Physella acuta TaxID=109671 RepID=UPI0027DAEF50|nr:neuroglian-like isoform X2 [Physella acuta]